MREVCPGILDRWTVRPTWPRVRRKVIVATVIYVPPGSHSTTRDGYDRQNRATKEVQYSRESVIVWKEQEIDKSYLVILVLRILIGIMVDGMWEDNYWRRKFLGMAPV